MLLVLARGTLSRGGLLGLSKTTSNPWVLMRYFSSFPQHTKITLPALSPTMTEGGLAKWKKKDGDSVKPGDVLCEVETDKATVDFEYQDDGTLAKTLVKEGTTGLKVGCVIGIMVDDASNVAAFANATFADFNASSSPSAAPAAPVKPQVVVEKLKPAPSTSAPPAGAVPPQKPAAPTKSSPPTSSTRQQQPQRTQGERIFASPLAKKLAREMNRDLASIKGSGPNGRIIADDVRASPEEATLQQQSTTGDTSWVLNKLLTPHYYLNVDVDLTEVLSLKDSFNKGRKDNLLTVNDFFIRASALCMKRVPEANAAWGDGGAFRIYDYCDVNVTVTTPDGLTKSPLIHNVQAEGLDEISTKLRQITSSVIADGGKDLDETPGTFSIVNVGEYGVRSIVPIVRPGQTTALGIGALRRVLIPSDSSATSAKVATVSTVTLSCDHRVVDGAIGAQWLHHFKSMLEKPLTMLL